MKEPTMLSIALKPELHEPTKSNLSSLLREVLNIKLPSVYPEKGGLQVATILHRETLAEFKPYEKLGWISITSNGNFTYMGVGNRLDNSIEDKKRPWGFGYGYVITFHNSLFGR